MITSYLVGRSCRHLSLSRSGIPHPHSVLGHRWLIHSNVPPSTDSRMASGWSDPQGNSNLATMGDHNKTWLPLGDVPKYIFFLRGGGFEGRGAEENKPFCFFKEGAWFTLTGNCYSSWQNSTLSPVFKWKSRAFDLLLQAFFSCLQFPCPHMLPVWCVSCDDRSCL